MAWILSVDIIWVTFNLSKARQPSWRIALGICWGFETRRPHLSYRIARSQLITGVGIYRSSLNWCQNPLHGETRACSIRRTHTSLSICCITTDALQHLSELWPFVGTERSGTKTRRTFFSLKPMVPKAFVSKTKLGERHGKGRENYVICKKRCFLACRTDRSLPTMLTYCRLPRRER